jgi:hypothetical protein
MSQFCDTFMAWNIKGFTVSAGNQKTIVSEWYDSQTEDVQAAFLVRMEFLIQRPRWDRPFVGQLRRDCAGLFEIIFKVANVQHRPIGYFSGQREFTFLAFATERDGKFDPKNICDTAFKRKALIEANKERAREIRF